MRLISRLNTFVHRSFHRQEFENDLDDEIRCQVELMADQKMQEGMKPEEAWRAAKIEFGGVEQVKEQVRAVRTGVWADSLFQDIRFALRILRKSPGFTATTVLVLALGIGATTAVFSLVNAVTIRSLPYGDASQLVYIYTPNRYAPHAIPKEAFGPSYGDFHDIQNENHSFSRVAFFAYRQFDLKAGDTAQRISGVRVSADFFATLEDSPELGRAIEAEDTQLGHEHVVVISHALWKSGFGGVTAVLGKDLLLSGETFQIIGVMPPAFHIPQSAKLQTALGGTDESTQVWVPLALTLQQATEREGATGMAIGRLRPGVTEAQAQAEMSAIIARVARLHSAFGSNIDAYVEPLVAVSVGEARPLMWWLLGAVSLVLLIACGNAANLLLVRAVSRTHEMGVRSALGATPGRLVRQMITEAIVLGFWAGLFGLLLAWLEIRILLRFNPGTIPRLDETSIDGRVLMFALGVAFLAGVLFGILPAIMSSRIRPASLLKQGGEYGKATFSRLRRALVVAEVSLAVVLLASAGLFIGSYRQLITVSTGFSQPPLTMNISLDTRYGTAEKRKSFFRNAMSTISALPGVQVAGAIDFLPLSQSETVAVFTAEGYPNRENQIVESRGVTEDYFRAIGIPVLEGRAFDEGDISAAGRIIVVNEAFVRKYFPHQDGLGKHVCLCPPTSKVFTWLTVIGVVAGVRNLNMKDKPAPQIYTPFWNDDNRQAYIVARTNFPAAQLIPSIRQAIRAIDPALAVGDIRTMEQRESAAAAPLRFQTFLFSVFAGIALFLAAIGLYGTITYSVKQRTHEIGIRLALGARRKDILSAVIFEGLALTLLGLALGVGGALCVARLLKTMLYGVAPNDPSTFAIVSVVLATVALASSYIPARRATCVDPMVALRHE